jgi:hypothetical protein
VVVVEVVVVEVVVVEVVVVEVVVVEVVVVEVVVVEVVVVVDGADSIQPTSWILVPQKHNCVSSVLGPKTPPKW